MRSTWTLDELEVEAPTLGARIDELERRVSHLGADADAWVRWLVDHEEALLDAVGPSSLGFCRSRASGDPADARSRSHAMERIHRLMSMESHLAAALAGPVGDLLVARPELADRRAQLNRLREEQQHRFAPEVQTLVDALEREGVQGWSELYHHLAGQLRIELTEPEPRTVGLTASVALVADPDPQVRAHTYRARERAWEEVAPQCAMALTHITGSRRTRAQRLGAGPMDAVLTRERIDGAVLEAMWTSVHEIRPLLHRSLQRRAAQMGKERMDWWDLGAPPVGETTRLSWEEGAQTVIAAFGAWDPAWGDFARAAIDNGWVDAAPAEGKAQGAFCAGFPRHKQSRIMLSFDGSLGRLLSLAHELGHAWHYKVLFERPFAQRAITAGTAETASLFAESLLCRHLAAQGSHDQILDLQLTRACRLLLEMEVRHRFELALYEMRSEGQMSAAQLTGRMATLQREVYGDSLGETGPTYWLDTRHFYMPSRPFYNLAYTFGYLFSTLVGHAGVGAAEVDEVLRRTGVEGPAELAADVLGVDLRSAAGWSGATSWLTEAVAG